MSETWKDVYGYEGLYQISSSGRLRGRYGKSKSLLSPNPDMYDIHYLKIALKRKLWLIGLLHRRL